MHQEFLSRNSWANGTQWAGGVINAETTYSLSLWKYRCELLYGRTIYVAEWMILTELHRKVTLAYGECEKDPFNIRQDYKHLFAISLDRRLQQDRDCLQCFLSTLALAKEERVQYIKLQSENARRFFFLWSLPTAVHFSLISESSQMSDMTGLTVLLSQDITVGSSESSCASTCAGTYSFDCDSQVFL